jgi:hypothetical protein
MKQIWTSVQGGDWWAVVVAGVIYTLATTEGSVFMMRILLKKEKGKHRIGNYEDPDRDKSHCNCRMRNGAGGPE